MYAVSNGRVEIVDMLLKAGADLNEKNSVVSYNVLFIIFLINRHLDEYRNGFHEDCCLFFFRDSQHW